MLQKARHLPGQDRGMTRRITDEQWREVEKLLRERTVSVADISRRTAVSRSSIYRRFPNVRGQFGAHAMAQQGMDQVEELLRSRQLTVAEISTRTGISKSFIYKQYPRPRQRFGRRRRSPPGWRSRARRLLADGEITVTEACRRFCVHKSSLYKYARSERWPNANQKS